MSSSKARTVQATSSNFDEVAAREYVGGVGEAKALATVTRERDNRPAMALCDKPSATLRRLISAQSFIVIIHPICRGWSTFQRAFLVQFSASVDIGHSHKVIGAQIRLFRRNLSTHDHGGQSNTVGTNIGTTTRRKPIQAAHQKTKSLVDKRKLSPTSVTRASQHCLVSCPIPAPLLLSCWLFLLKQSTTLRAEPTTVLHRTAHTAHAPNLAGPTRRTSVALPNDGDVVSYEHVFPTGSHNYA